MTVLRREWIKCVPYTHIYHPFKNVIPFAGANGKLSVELAPNFGLGGVRSERKWVFSSLRSDVNFGLVGVVYGN